MRCAAGSELSIESSTSSKNIVLLISGPLVKYRVAAVGNRTLVDLQSMCTILYSRWVMLEVFLVKKKMSLVVGAVPQSQLKLFAGVAAESLSELVFLLGSNVMELAYGVST